MNDKAPQVTNLKDAKMWIDQLWDVVGEQTKTIHSITLQVESLSKCKNFRTLIEKTIHECLNVSFTSESSTSAMSLQEASNYQS